MPVPKTFKTSLKDIEKDMKSATTDLYKQAAMEQVATAVAATVTRRRNKPESIIPRQNGKLLFLEWRHIEAIEQIHWTAKVDRQDVIRTAVDEFLDRYYNGERLSEEGQEKIRRYYDKTHR